MAASGGSRCASSRLTVPFPRLSLRGMPSPRGMLAGVLVLAASACAPERRTAVDLVQSFAEAEVRGDDLDLATLAADPAFERRGWSRLEGPAGRRMAWAQGPRSRLRLPFQSTGDKELYMKVRSHESLGPSLPLSLALNDAPLAQIAVAPAEQELRVAVQRLQVREVVYLLRPLTAVPRSFLQCDLKSTKARSVKSKRSLTGRGNSSSAPRASSQRRIMTGKVFFRPHSAARANT